MKSVLLPSLYGMPSIEWLGQGGHFLPGHAGCKKPCRAFPKGPAVPFIPAGLAVFSSGSFSRSLFHAGAALLAPENGLPCSTRLLFSLFRFVLFLSEGRKTGAFTMPMLSGWHRLFPA